MLLANWRIWSSLGPLTLDGGGAQESALYRRLNTSAGP